MDTAAGISAGDRTTTRGRKGSIEAAQVETRRAVTEDDGGRNRQRLTQEFFHAFQHPANQRGLQSIR